jgi:tripartite-type tricarboxylate transporter receptor subunit TctC
MAGLLNGSPFTGEDCVLTRRLCLQATIGAALLAPARAAENWPQRNVKFIIPLGPGSGADIGARLIAARLQEKWGVPVIVENRPGGDSLISVGAFLGANDDHVLLFAAPGSFTVHPFQFANLPYDFDRDLLPIAQVSNTVIALAASTSTGITDLKELVQRNRATPGTLNCAVPAGIGELILDGFITSEGLKPQKVPYRDIVQGATDLAAGRLDFMMGSYAMLLPATQSGKARFLAVNSRERMPSSPDVPTAIEQGFPVLELEGLIGLFGPKTMSQELRERIGADVVSVATGEQLEKQLLGTGQVLRPGGALEFKASIERQKSQVAKIANMIGMKPK